MRRLRCVPQQRGAFGPQVAWGKQRFALHHGRNDGAPPAVVDKRARLKAHARFHAAAVLLIVDDGAVVELACADGIVARFDDKEVFQRPARVEACREVRQVVAKLHRLVVQPAVGPASQHGRGGFEAPLAARAASVAGKFEMLHRHGELRLCGCRIGGNAHAQPQFAAARVVHAHLQRAQRPVVFAGVVKLGLPRPAFVLAHGEAILVGAVDEALVGPAVAPRVDDDPGSALVLARFAIKAVAVQVEDGAVVIPHDGQGMVHAVSPACHILFPHQPGSFVLSGGVVCHVALFAGAGHADAANAARVKRRVAAMVPEPVLHQFASLFGVEPIGRERVVRNAVLHGFKPFVVALHPAEIVGAAVLVAEEARIGRSAVCRGVGHAVGHRHALFPRVAVCQQPGEVRRIDMVRGAGRVAAQGIDFVGEHVADARGRTAGASVLVENGRKVGLFGVVYVSGAFSQRVAGSTVCRELGSCRTRSGSQCGDENGCPGGIGFHDTEVLGEKGMLCFPVRCPFTEKV